MSGTTSLVVLMDGARAGVLSCERRDEMTYSYDPSYVADPNAVPLSLSLPLAERAYRHKAIATWVESLLPDDSLVLSRWYDREHTQPRSPFGLLSTRIGLDCAGAVQFCPEHRLGTLQDRRSDLHRLNDRQMEREIALITRDPAAWTPDDVEPYFSLGGAHTKMALHLTDAGWARPSGDIPTTHILKPRAETFIPTRDGEWPSLGFPLLAAGGLAAVGEHLCLAVARRLGLEAALSWLEIHGAHVVVVVERFDRAEIDGRWARIHQEDMCQALGISGMRRYEHSGGPGMTQIGDLLHLHSVDPERDVSKFADALVYAWLVVNRDAHARNYGLLHRADEGTRLAPLYDLHSSLMFGVKRIGELELAMRYGSDFTLYRAGAETMLPTMAARLRLSPNTLVDRAEELADGLAGAMQAEIGVLPDSLRHPQQMADFMDRLERRIAACRKTIANTRAHIGHYRSPASAAASETPVSRAPGDLCNKTVKSTGMRCLLPDGHKGWCRSR